MRIAIIGYGKMGKAIEAQAIKNGHEIASIIDPSVGKMITDLHASLCDVAIEFTQPDVAFDNISYAISKQIPIVSGTTGWYDKLPEIKGLCERQNGTVLCASNFSIGMNIMFRMTRWLSAAMSQFPEYQINISETHHIHKKDQPSGTAISLAQEIITHHVRYTNWAMYPQSTTDLPVTSYRVGEEAGLHEVKFSSAIDDITLIHHAKSRDGFAIGAVMAAVWLAKQQGFKTMDDFIRL